MQSTVMRTSALGSVRPFQSHLRRINTSRTTVCVARANCTLQRQQQQQQQLVTGFNTLSLSVALLVQPLAAWADEAVISSPEASAAAVGAAENTVPAPSWLGYVVLLSPLILYAIFNVYRSQANPRAKFTDFLFIVAGVAVIANLVSILAFKVRLF